MIDLKKEIGKLSDAEKILLLEDIWESISEKRKNKLSISQKKEIDRRLELEEKGEVRYYSLDEVRLRVQLCSK